MTNRQKEFFESRFKQLNVQGWDKLQPKLKEQGGEMLVPVPQSPEMVQLLLGAGRAFETDKVLHQPGEPSQCYKNALKNWAGHENLQVVMGYGLSDDGGWRQHAWLWDPTNNQIIETTVPRVKYFGVVLTDVQAFILSQQYVQETDYQKAAERFFTCAKQIKERMENEGVESLLLELKALVADSTATEQGNQQTINNILKPHMLTKIAGFKSGDSNQRTGAEPPTIQNTPTAPNLPDKERAGICRRWSMALRCADLIAEIPTQKQKITLKGSGYPKDVKIRSIGAILHLTNIGKDYATTDSIPDIIVSVYHNRGIIADDSAFANGISAAISKAIGKSARVKFMTQEMTQQPDRLLMVSADPESGWNLADFILRANGYDTVPQCSHASGTCPICGDLIDPPND